MSLKDNKLTLSFQKCKQLASIIKNDRSYKLLNMTTPKKTLRTVRTFSFKNKSMLS